MLNIYACQHPELQGSEKFLEAFLENAEEQERIKKRENLSEGRSGQ